MCNASAYVTNVSKLNLEIFPRIRSLILGCDSPNICASWLCEYCFAQRTICACSLDLRCRAADSAGENPRSSNTFRLRTFFLPFEWLILSGFDVSKSLFSQIQITWRSLVCFLFEAIQHVNPPRI